MASPPVQGATVLHRLARLYEIVVKGATIGATNRNTGCYILKSLANSDRLKGLSIPPEIARNHDLPGSVLNLNGLRETRISRIFTDPPSSDFARRAGDPLRGN